MKGKGGRRGDCVVGVENGCGRWKATRVEGKVLKDLTYTTSSLGAG